ncbi:MAG: HEPN/Toprim-associated domain-containing protein [Caldisericia bacterium]
MGSEITLGIGRLEIDWGKNEFFNNHSKLFLKTDVAPATYYYAEGHTETQPAYVRKLGSVIRRLDLLGYTITECGRDYRHCIESTPEGDAAPEMTFETFMRVLASVDVNRVAVSGDAETFDLREFASRVVLGDAEDVMTCTQLESLMFDEDTFFQHLAPYVILRLLGENPKNLNEDVIWRFSDVVEGSWVEESELYEGLEDSDRYLVVTEGSSDSSILERSLPLLEPDVADFFSFVDMSHNYPFTGTGSLANFCKGLSTIRIQNKILVVVDNDTAGLSAGKLIAALPLPASMRVVALPSISEFANFRTIGPTGEALEDVNGRAVAIECFLDLRYGPQVSPAIRWTSYDSAAGQYQGELIQKKDYTLAFFEHCGKDAGYDLTKLKLLWSYLLKSCVS